ncbi:Hsp33 family molecular chaperone [Kaistia dalseonensis]|uniref:Molecular chaperone Hsp33 n=1 Tax=Kaistia dalseonensis TaxID=410840 RepID=A0ABU0HFV1_9HYPH|nr:Hsp33 family molecular chaperone [Kaistia dalseonensis]MCX5497767.1 Hsp33 family molecular chaperone [Kaistia dalseonensis]MDQ0440411.1 molecular chaperone Hsp33 [Kaistia dalseonensis]
MTNIEDFGPGSIAPAGVDAVLPFQVEGLDVRGRSIQMGPALSTLLDRHNYPLPVSKLLGEAVVLAVLLGSSLKFEGQFILQTQTDGPVDMLVVDFRTPGDLRAYARFDAEKVAEMEAAGTLEPALLLGNGILAMTIDQGENTSRYQGIVALDGSSLEDVAHTYFEQSEQIPTAVRLAVAEMMTREDGKVTHSWRGGGLMVQFLPESEDRMRHRDLPGGDAPSDLDFELDEDDAWVEAQSLVATIEDHELIDPDVSTERLLYRLFHERGVRVFEATAVQDHCSCSRERIEGVLRSFSAEEITESIEDGEITVTCEFCGLVYRFDPAEFSN